LKKLPTNLMSTYIMRPQWSVVSGQWSEENDRNYRISSIYAQFCRR